MLSLNCPPKAVCYEIMTVRIRNFFFFFVRADRCGDRVSCGFVRRSENFGNGFIISAGDASHHWPQTFCSGNYFLLAINEEKYYLNLFKF